MYLVTKHLTRGVPSQIELEALCPVKSEGALMRSGGGYHISKQQGGYGIHSFAYKHACMHTYTHTYELAILLR